MNIFYFIEWFCHYLSDIKFVEILISFVKWKIHLSCDESFMMNPFFVLSHVDDISHAFLQGYWNIFSTNFRVCVWIDLHDQLPTHVVGDRDIIRVLELPTSTVLLNDILIEKNDRKGFTVIIISKLLETLYKTDIYNFFCFCRSLKKYILVFSIKFLRIGNQILDASCLF